MDVFDQSSYKGLLAGLTEHTRGSGFVAFEVRVFLYNMTRDDQSKMSRMTKNSRQSARQTSLDQRSMASGMSRSRQGKSATKSVLSGGGALGPNNLKNQIF